MKPNSQAPDTTLRVLVVDDDEVDRMVVRRSLTRAGVDAQLTEAGGASAAIELLEGNEFDCVVLDYNLPGTDGLTLLRRIRRDTDAAVIMLTGQGDEQVAVELMKAGAVDYLQKGSLTPERLASSLRYALELSRASRLARQAEDELRDSALRASFLAEASAILSSAPDTGRALSGVAGRAVPYLADACHIHLLQRDGATSVTATAPADLTSAGTHAAGIDGAVREVIDSGTRRVLHDAGAGVLILPMMARKRTLGAVVLVRGGDRSTFSQAEEAVAADLAQRAAIAVDNARLYETAEEARRRTERLQHVTASLAAALPRQAVGDLFVDQVRAALAADTAWVALLNEDGSELRTLVHGGYAPDELERWMTIPRDVDIPAWNVIRDGEPRWFDNRSELEAEHPVVRREEASVPAQSSVGVLPLDAGRGIFGILTVGSRRARSFSEDDRALALALAGQFAQALERARLYEAEREARERAESANRAKSEFLARMSHDLRTPLNAIGGYSELISMGIHGPVTPPQVEAITRIQRAKDHLLTLINDILGFAKLEAGQVTIEIAPVSLRDMIGELTPLIQPQIETKGLEWKVVAGDDGHVAADRERLLQVLINLLTNALKFTPSGGSVTVSWELDGEFGAIRIEDTGIGIAPDRLQSIFEPFVQARGSAADSAEGVGLGLAISRELMRLMDGDLDVESEEGVGSVFTLKLPVAAATEPMPAAG